jgi:hypothetical protein
VTAAGVFGGLVGAMLGGGIGVAVVSNRAADDGNKDKDDKESL